MVKNQPFLFFLFFFVLFHGACYSQVAKQPGYVAGEILVKFKASVSRTEAESFHKHCGSKILKHFKGINADLVKIKKGWTVLEAIEAYRADPNVEYAEPNYTRGIKTKKR